MKLNGWQRLWLVLSILYLVPVIFLTMGAWPKRSDIENKWVYETIDIIRDRDDSVYDIRSAYSDLSNQELVRRIHEKYGDDTRFSKQSFEEVDKRYEERLDNLTNERLKTLGIASVAWVIPLLGIYFLGLAVSWIYRGFKER